jgi:delta 1-pyrroline-5-carboxylate dehydrogenase
MSGTRAADAFARVERELSEERAAALRRIAGTLETQLERLTALRLRLQECARHERAEILAEYARLREAARLWRWYLVVQREAVAFSRHDDLERFYPLPPRLGG